MIAAKSSAPAPDAQSELSARAKRMYDHLAPDYDRHLLHDCRYQTPRSAAAFLAERAPKVRGLWLDLGAGTGLVGRELEPTPLELALVAMDLSRAMLEQVTAPSYVACCLADIQAGVPFDHAVFDGAFAIGFFDHILDPSWALAELARTTRPGAHLLLSYSESPGLDVEVFDEESGLVRHAPALFERCLAQAGWMLQAQLALSGYESYREKVAQRIVLAVR